MSVKYKVPTIPRAKPPPTQKRNSQVSGSVHSKIPTIPRAKPPPTRPITNRELHEKLVNNELNKLPTRELHEKLRNNLINNELNKLTNTQLYGKLNTNLGRLIQPTRSPPKSRNVLNSNQNAQNQLLKRWKKPIPINSRKSKKLREEGKFNSLMNRVRRNSPRATKKLNA